MSQIYALTDANLTPLITLKAQIKELLDGGVRIIQYRNKNQNHDIDLLKDINQICKDSGARFIINDDANLAKIIEASGVHIGKDDGSLQRARNLLGYDAYIGVSCYNDLECAKNAVENGADYIAFGSMFVSSIKPGAPICSFDIVKEAKSKLNTKIAVIGGINSSNIDLIKELDIEYIAIISALYTPNSITQNLAKLNTILKG